MSYAELGISSGFEQLARQADQATSQVRAAVRETVFTNQWKVLRAFQAEGLGEGHFAPTTGYGYGDLGRELLDRVVARIFRAESGLLRHQFVSGTHAISAGLFGSLELGQNLVSLTGPPYDTLMPVIGPGRGSLESWGVGYRELALCDGQIDLDGIDRLVDANTGAVFLQRSRGYTWRKSFALEELGSAMERVRQVNPVVTILVDNCYGELVEAREPIELGADLVAGSLIKNLGGGLLTTGGYLAGQASAVEGAALVLTAPGIGGEQGPSLGHNRSLAQGLFMAPQTVGQALEGAIWAAWMMEKVGLETSPVWDEPRTDLIQAVRLGSPEAQLAFCRGVQKAGPVDHSAQPTPVVNPGYRDPILMAGGTFVAGSSIEVSADGPVRPPYACYLQGGLSLSHVQMATLLALTELDQGGFLP